jgi:hypothetical protein
MMPLAEHRAASARTFSRPLAIDLIMMHLAAKIGMPRLTRMKGHVVAAQLDGQFQEMAVTAMQQQSQPARRRLINQTCPNSVPQTRP